MITFDNQWRQPRCDHCGKRITSLIQAVSFTDSDRGVIYMFCSELHFRNYYKPKRHRKGRMQTK